MTNSCSSLKKTNPEKEPYEIIFGKSGGFTNIPMEYKISENGEVFKIQNNKVEKINSISKTKLKTISNLFLDCDFEDMEINDLGNITYYITVRSKKYENTVKWNDSNSNDKLKNLYKTLLSTINL